jgi:hypothetical protein
VFEKRVMISSSPLLRARKESRRKSILLLVAFGLYIALAAMFAASAPDLILYVFGAGATVSCVALMFRNFVSSLYLLVLATHIGPIVRATIPGIGIVTLGDLYLAFLLFVFSLRVSKGKILTLPFRGFALAMFAMSATTLILAADVIAALPGVINMAQVAFIYIIIYNEVKTRKQVDGLLNGIGIGVLISAVLHLIFYLRGESLALSGQDEGQLAALLGDIIAPEYIRTSFFYVSFHASSAVGIVLGIRHLLRMTGVDITVRIFWLFVLAAALSSSLVSSSKTTILAAGFVFIFIVFSYIRHAKRGHGLQLALLTVSIATIPIMVFQSVVTGEQQSLLQDSILSDSAVSMGERFLMWSEFPQKVLSSPKELMFGLGPGVPERAPENESVRKIMYISSIQFQPFSFHNFYADVIVQHGAIFFSLMAAVIVSTVRRLWTLVRKGDVLAADLFYAISAWLLVWMTHSTGWSKPVAILSVLFALGHLLISNRLAPEGPLNKYVAREETQSALPYLRAS